MAEYIERENAIAWFMPYAHVGESIDADVVISDIKGMKAADVATVRHGRWERYSDDKFVGYDENGRLKYRKVYKHECSVCLRETAVKSNYCPKCGAKMDG